MSRGVGGSELFPPRDIFPSTSSDQLSWPRTLPGAWRPWGHHARLRAGPGLGELDRTRGHGKWAVGALSPCVSQERKGERVFPDGVGGAWSVRAGPWEELTFGADLTDDRDGQLKSRRTFQARGLAHQSSQETSAVPSSRGSWRVATARVLQALVCILRAGVLSLSFKNIYMESSKHTEE